MTDIAAVLGLALAAALLILVAALEAAAAIR